MPFAVSILISAGACLALNRIAVPEATNWFRETWGTDGAQVRNVVKHLLLTGTVADLNNPMWSLWHELRVSLIFPLLVFTVKYRWKYVLVASVVLAIFSLKLQAPMPGNLIIKSFLRTIVYLPTFVVGIIISLHHRNISRFVSNLAKPIHVLLWLIAFTLVAAPFDGRVELDEVIRDFFPSIVLPCMGAALITILALSEGRALSILIGTVPIYLGKISYSLYLTHVIVFASVIRILHDSIGLGASLTASLIIAFPVAHIFNKAVEMPAMRLGRKLANRL